MSNLKLKIKNFRNSLKRNGIKTETRRIINLIKYKKTVPNDYEEWILVNEPDKKEWEREKRYSSLVRTKFLLILPDEESRKMIENQTYNNYEIVIAKPNEYADIIDKNESDYCIFIGKRIKIQPFALYALMDFIENNSECDAIYSDNDYIVDRKRVNPEFKPHYAYYNLLSKNYIGNFFAVNTKILKENKSLIKGLNIKEPIYDIIIRIAEHNWKIKHIDMVLYHKLDERINLEEQKKILINHLDRKNISYDNVENGKFEGQYKINYKIVSEEKVSIIIPNMEHIEDLKKCINSIFKSTYKNYEIIIVENNSKSKEIFEYYDELQNKYSNIKVIKIEINEFNYSKIVNYGVENSDGKYIVMLNNDIEILSKDWLEQMLMYVQKENVGICGARLYFEDDSVQHAGVTIGIRGLAGHKYRELSKSQFSAKDSVSYVQELSAVTAACFMTKREDWNKVLGFDEKLAVAFNDVDFCMKIRKKNKFIIYNPFVEAYHYESKSRGEDTENKEKQERFAREYAIFVKRWRRTISKGDPYYSKNYRLDTDLPRINYNKIN